MYGCDGRLVPDYMVDFGDRMCRDMAPYRWLLDADQPTRLRLYQAERRRRHSRPSARR